MTYGFDVLPYGPKGRLTEVWSRTMRESGLVVPKLLGSFCFMFAPRPGFVTESGIVVPSTDETAQLLGWSVVTAPDNTNQQGDSVAVDSAEVGGLDELVDAVVVSSKKIIMSSIGGAVWGSISDGITGEQQEALLRIDREIKAFKPGEPAPAVAQDDIYGPNVFL